MLIGSVGTDTRMLESSTGRRQSLRSQFKTVVIAYVYAAPVAIPGFTPTDSTNVTPPVNVTRTNSTDSMYKYVTDQSLPSVEQDRLRSRASPATPVRTSTPTGRCITPVQTEFTVVKGSLLGKALVAQAVFDAHFLQEFAPDATTVLPDSGQQKQVTRFSGSRPTPRRDRRSVLRRCRLAAQNHGKWPARSRIRSTIRTTVSSTSKATASTAAAAMRRAALKLLIQFDYAGTTIKDYTGFVEQQNPTGCAPELGITVGCPATTPAGGFPTPANPTPLGTAPTRFVAYNIGTNFDASGNAYPLMFVDQTSGTRLALNGNTTAIATAVDTVVSGFGDESSGDVNPPLADTGVPFIFIDVAGAPGCSGCGVNNGVNYFYSVTAFDVNAPGHGPTSLESARVTKQVVPQAAAGNFNNASTIATGTFGRHGLLTDNVAPTLDPVTGEFSKAFPPANGTTLALAGFAPQAISGSGSVSFIFDSTHMNSITSNGTTMVIADFYRLVSNTGVVTSTSVPFSITQTQPAGRTRSLVRSVRRS